MSKKTVFSSFKFILISLLSFLMSCEKTSHKYGADFTIDEKPMAASSLVLGKDRYNYVGKVVKVEGEIAAVCKQKGCYFSLMNPRLGTKVYVDLEGGKNFTIPIDSEGKLGVVEGKFFYEMDTANRGWKIIANAVEIHDE